MRSDIRFPPSKKARPRPKTYCRTCRRQKGIQLFLLLSPVRGIPLPVMLQRIEQFPAGLIPVLLPDPGAFQKDRLKSGRKGRIDAADGTQGVGAFPCEQLKQHDPQTVDICPRIAVSLSVILLRRSIASGPQRNGILSLSSPVFPRSPKVNQHYIAVRLQHHIGRLHIPIDDRRLPPVQISQRITELFRPHKDFLPGLRPVFIQKILQRTSFDIIHYDQQGVSVLDHIHNPRKMRMVQLLHHLDLSLIGIQVICVLLSDLLDCPLPVDPLIHGQIDHTHASSPDHVQDLVFSIHYGTILKHSHILPEDAPPVR